MSSQAYLGAFKKAFLYKQIRWKKWEERASPKESEREIHPIIFPLLLAKENTWVMQLWRIW